jgi:prophage DNA circulation protein
MTTVQAALREAAAELELIRLTAGSAGIARSLRSVVTTLRKQIDALNVAGDPVVSVCKVMASHRSDPTIMICERLFTTRTAAEKWRESIEGNRILAGRNVQFVWENLS